MNKKQKNLLKAAIITMSFVQMGTNGIAPILAQIADAFPDASATTIQFLMTFPSIFCLIFTLISAFLADVLPKKTLALAGLSIVAAGGVLACCFHSTLGILYLWAAVLGIGIGMVAPVAPALVNEKFEASEKATMLGWQNSANTAGSMLMTFIGGFLALSGWPFGYLVYLLAIPGIIFTLIGLPGDRKDKTVRREKPKRERFRLVIWKEMIITFVLLMVFSAVPANLAMLVAERGLGDTSVSGTMSTVFLAGGMVAGIFFGKIAGLIKNKTDLAGALCLTLGAVVIAVSSALPLLFIGCFFAGASISLVMPTCMGAAGRLKGYEAINSALLLSASFVGVFITPLLTSLTAAITGSDSVTYRFFMVAIVGVVLIVLTIILKRKPKGFNAKKES